MAENIPTSAITRAQSWRQQMAGHGRGRVFLAYRLLCCPSHESVVLKSARRFATNTVHGTSIIVITMYVYAELR